MNIPLSKRLLTCAGFVRPGDRIADIGCDHGYLSIYLLKNNIASEAIAADINEMPLQSARRNAERFCVGDKIRFFLSDGVKSIPKDFDTLICAGMGADTMVSILQAAPWLECRQYRLILQCQSKTHMLRQYLSEHGFSIERETVLRDGRFLYTVMEVIWAPDMPRLTVGGWYLPPALLTNAYPETAEYIFRVMDGLRLAVEHRNDPEKKQALEELEIIYPPDKELL